MRLGRTRTVHVSSRDVTEHVTTIESSVPDRKRAGEKESDERKKERKKKEKEKEEKPCRSNTNNQESL